MSAGVPETLRRLVLHQLRAAVLESRLDDLARTGRIPTVAAPGDARIAQIAAGLACREGDLLFGTRRDLPAALARGVSLGAILSQVLGTAADPALGRGLPGALRDSGAGVLLGDGGPAAHLVHAAGFGLAARMARQPRAALALFGSSAWAHGEMHAALNFAAVGRSATVFVARGPRAGEPWLDEVASAWGLAAVRVRGDDGQAILAAVEDARARATAGQGPALVDVRLDAPSQPLDAVAYRDAGGYRDRPEVTVRAEIEAEVETALRTAEAAPAVGDETLWRELFA